LHAPTPTSPDVECTSTELPVTYTRFADMVEPGDSIYLGRYLVSGADSASLYLKVRALVCDLCDVHLNLKYAAQAAVLGAAPVCLLYVSWAGGAWCWFRRQGTVVQGCAKFDAGRGRRREPIGGVSACSVARLAIRRYPVGALVM
jgi:hypothetical protein